MFVVAATLFNHMQRTRNSVRRLDWLEVRPLWTFVNMLFSGKRALTNIRGGAEEKIKELSDVLLKRRKAFLDQATISTEITAFHILDDVANISTQLQNLSSRVSDVGR